MYSAAGAWKLLLSSGLVRFSLCGLQKHQHGLWLQPKHSQCLQPVVSVRRVLPNHSSLWNTCLCPSVPRVCFFPPTVGMLLLLIHKEFRPNPKHLFSDFKLHLFCIHTVGDQLSSTVLPLPPPPHSLPKHRAESRPQAYQFLRQPSHNSSRATEQERLKKEGAKGKESLSRL